MPEHEPYTARITPEELDAQLRRDSLKRVRSDLWMLLNTGDAGKWGGNAVSACKLLIEKIDEEI